MSDLIDQRVSLSDYISSNNKPPGPQGNTVELSRYVDSATNPIYDPLNYTNPNLRKFMNSPVATNRLQIADDRDKAASELATSYLMAQELGIDVSKVIENYPQYSRHFFGDKSPVSNWQHIKDAYTEGEYGTKMDLLATEYIKSPYSPEKEKKFLAELSLLEAKMPPNYDDRGNVLMKAATGSAAQIYRQIKSAEYLSPIPDIQRRLREVEDKDGSSIAGLLKGMNDYITGYDTDKDRTAYVTKWQATLGSFALGQGITLATSLYYSETETGNTYLALSRIKTPDTIGKDGELIPGKGLDEDTKRALARIAGPIKGLSEAYLEKFGAKLIPGVNKLFGSPKFLTKVITDSAVKMGVKGALLKALQSAGRLEFGEVTTEIFQGAIDISANNITVGIDENSDLFKDDIIDAKEAAAIGIETFVETFWTVAPTAFFGGGFTGIVDIINQDKYKKEDIKNIINSNVVISMNSENGFSTKEVQELVKNDPRMFKYSDRGIEQAASKAVISEELGIELGKAPEFTLEAFKAMEEQKSLEAYKKTEPAFEEGTEEFEKMFTQWKKDENEKLDDELKVNNEELYSIYEKQHLGQTRVEIKTTIDANGEKHYEEIKVPVEPSITFEQFKEQRRTNNAYVKSWQSLPDARKYFATMQPSVDVIKRVMNEEMDVETRASFQKSQDKVQSLITEAIAGSRVASIEDFDTETKMEVKVLESRIEELEKIGRQYVDTKHKWRQTASDKVSMAAVIDKIIELHKTKYEIESTFGKVKHILETVSREIYNNRRIGGNLKSIHERLIEKITEYESDLFQDLFSGKLPKAKMIEQVKKAIMESSELAGDTELAEAITGFESEMKTMESIMVETLDDTLKKFGEDNEKKAKLLSNLLLDKVPNINKESAMLLIKLVEYRANKLGLSLEDFASKYFNSKPFRGPESVIQGVKANYVTADKKMYMGFWPSSTLPVVIHEFGHMFQDTLNKEDQVTLDEWLEKETVIRLEAESTLYQNEINRLMEKKNKITKNETSYVKKSIEIMKRYATIIKDYRNGKITEDYKYEMRETFAHSFQEYVENNKSFKPFLQNTFNKFVVFIQKVLGKEVFEYTGMKNKLPDNIIKLLDEQFSDILTTEDGGLGGSFDFKNLMAEEKLNEQLEVSADKLWKKSIEVEKVKYFKKMVISRMQKSLSNYLKIQGEIYMKSINSPVSSKVSQSVKDKIEEMQKAITLVSGAVSTTDINKARDFVNDKLFPVDDTSELGIKVETDYPIASKRVAEMLMKDFKITFDANATGIRPKLSISQLIELKTEIDLLRYQGRLEFTEANKNNLISKEVRKSEFLIFQKEIFNRSSKEKKLLHGLNFDSMSAAHWAEDLFGKYGKKMFFTDKNIADNNERLEKNRRSKEVLSKLNLTEKELVKVMFEEREFEGKMYPVQKLMYYYLGHTDQNIYNSLASVNANNVNINLLGKPGVKVNEAEKMLTEKEKQIANVLQQDLEKAWTRAAAVYEMSPEHRRLGKLSFYLPKPVYDMQHEVMEDELFDNMIRGTDYTKEGTPKSFTLERKETPKDTKLEIQDDLWDIWQNYIHKQEHYIAHTQWVRDTKGFMADDTIRNTIKENYNPHWVDGINAYIDHVANPSSLHGATGFDNIFRKLKHNTAISALWGRSTIMARQLPSIAMYLSEAGAKEFGSAIVQFQNAYYMEGAKVKNHIVDMIMEVDPTSIDTKTGYDLLHYKPPKTKISGAIRKTQEFGMLGIYALDRNVKATGWLSIYNKNFNIVGPEKAIELARDYTVLYQPSGDRTTLPGMYNHSEFMNLALMFTQQPTKIFQYTRREVLPNLNPLSKDANRLKGLYGMMAVMSMNTAIWVLTQRRVPEDWKDWAIASTIGSIGTIPGAGKIIQDKLQGRTRYSQSTIETGVSTIFELANIKKWEGALNDPDKMATQIKRISKGAGILGFMSEFVNDMVDFGTTGDFWHVFAGGEKGEK